MYRRAIPRFSSASRSAGAILSGYLGELALTRRLPPDRPDRRIGVGHPLLESLQRAVETVPAGHHPIARRFREAKDRFICVRLFFSTVAPALTFVAVYNFRRIQLTRSDMMLDSMLTLAAILAIFVYGIIAAMLGTILPDISRRFNMTPKQNGNVAMAQAIGLMIGGFFVGPLMDVEG